MERHGYNTRSNFNINNWTITKKLFKPSARITNYGLEQLRINGPRIWNSLPDIKNATSICFLEKRLSSFYINVLLILCYYRIGTIVSGIYLILSFIIR